ncbi:MAG: hypothetical protein OQK48_00835 [Sulfurimonas sp.]|nr:hypothetical protein [Sulfurimonas sp.]MCW8894426.1 hypothetical protein [Sulfurimonas sp.]MCW8953469.1 hypothetical protein [Sulfurimonas sp.]MCW9067726.1 hypothetical protein [Sulfurimonas sp.]
MFKIIIPKAAFKELEKIDSKNQKLLYLKIKENDILVITLIRIAHIKEVY